MPISLRLHVATFAVVLLAIFSQSAAFTFPTSPAISSRVLTQVKTFSKINDVRRPHAFSSSRLITPLASTSSSTTASTVVNLEFDSDEDEEDTNSLDNSIFDPNDSISKLEESCAKVFALRSGKDKTLPKNMVGNGVRDYQHLWTNTEWEVHGNRMRYVRHLMGLPRSRILRRIAPALVILGAWTSMATNYGKSYSIPIMPVTLMSSFVAFLLTLRTNQSLSRVLEGRLAWGRTVLLTRDTSQLLAAYIYPKNKAHGLLAARHLSLFGWLLKSRLRDESDEDVVNSMLPATDARFVSSSRKRPVALLSRIRQIVANENNKGNLSSGAHRTLEGNLLELNRVYGMCERLRGSPIPPMYTRHTARLLLFWLMTIPFALTGSGLSPLVTMITTTVCGFITLGLDEISMQIEQPFRLMPMQPLAGAVMRDVADAFVCMPPRLPECEDDYCKDTSSNDNAGEPFSKPSYW